MVKSALCQDSALGITFFQSAWLLFTCCGNQNFIDSDAWDQFYKKLSLLDIEKCVSWLFETWKTADYFNYKYHFHHGSQLSQHSPEGWIQEEYFPDMHTIPVRGGTHSTFEHVTVVLKQVEGAKFTSA